MFCRRKLACSSHDARSNDLANSKRSTPFFRSVRPNLACFLLLNSGGRDSVCFDQNDRRLRICIPFAATSRSLETHKSQFIYRVFSHRFLELSAFFRGNHKPVGFCLPQKNKQRKNRYLQKFWVESKPSYLGFQAFSRRSRMLRGMPPLRRTSSWKAATEKLGPSRCSQSRRSSLILSWPIL